MMTRICCLWVVGMLASAAVPCAAADGKVSFAEQIKPILHDHCVKCHAGPNRKGGFAMDSRRVLLQGGKAGPAVVPGDSKASLLIELVTEADPELRMPYEKPPLTAEQIALLKRWIDEGLDWEGGFAFAQEHRAAPLAPRQPPLPDAPPGVDLPNPIDRLLQPYYTQHGVRPGKAVGDAAYARRLYLDIIGLLPTPAQIDGFVADTRSDKRARLVEALLADRRAYAEHWMTFWNDALRNDYRGTGYIDDGRKQITGWLFAALYDNMPYDRFVRELLTAAPGAEGYVKGIKWRGTVNASQRREMQAAQTTAQVFLGINLKCASCHDSFVNDWKLADAYAFASVFADEPLEVHRCDKPTGQTSKAGFIYPSLGEVKADAPLPQRLNQLADAMTHQGNGRLTRTMVNRLWAWFYGRGIVEPVDDMDAQPWSADVLDWLAEDLREHGYDLHRTITLMCTSAAYQAAAVPAPTPEQDKKFVFHGPIVKRMTAEQFIDAVSQVTGQWQPVKGDMLKADGRGQGGQLSAVRAVLAKAAGKSDTVGEVTGGKWIWSHANAAKSDPGGRFFLRKTLTLDDKPTRAAAIVTCDNEFVLYVNGQRVAESDNWQQPVTVDITAHLRKGSNVIAAEAANWPDQSTGKGLQHGPNPAAFALLAAGWNGDELSFRIETDPSWTFSVKRIEGWTDGGFDARGWESAHVLGDVATGQWKLPGRFAVSRDTSSDAPAGDERIRAVVADTDDLMRAMGRPNREQVVTRRDTLATTLQVLELTNGSTLDTMLKRGAERWVAAHPSDGGDALIEQVYLAALGRKPADAERDAAREVIGSPATTQGVQDLLWIITMLPEFQLIQ